MNHLQQILHSNPQLNLNDDDEEENEGEETFKRNGNIFQHKIIRKIGRENVSDILKDVKSL
jgi:hypothetical protein